MLENVVLRKQLVLLLEGAMLIIAPPVPSTYLHQTHWSLVHVHRVTTAYLSHHLLGSMLAPQELVVLAEWLAMPSSPLDTLLKHEPRMLPTQLLRYTTLYSAECRRPCPRCPPLHRCPPLPRWFSPVPDSASHKHQRRRRSLPDPPGLPAD